MTHELPEWDPLDPTEFAYTPLGNELHTELMNIRKLVRRDIAKQFPEESEAASIWWEAETVEETAHVPTYVEVVCDADAKLGKLLVERMCYNPKFDQHTGFDGFDCTKIGTKAISFRTISGLKIMDVSLMPDGYDVIEMVSSLGNAAVQHHFDKAAQLDTDDAERRLIEYVRNDDEDDTTLTLYDILGPYSVRFVPRVLAKMREVQAWFADCRSKGVDPFTDAAWTKDETYEFEY